MRSVPLFQSFYGLLRQETILGVVTLYPPELPGKSHEEYANANTILARTLALESL